MGGESGAGVEWLGVLNCIFFGSENQIQSQKPKFVLQAQNKDIIYLTQKRLKRDIFLSLPRESKVIRKRLFEPQKSLSRHLRVKKVSFWLLLSLFVERGKQSLPVSLESDR